MAELVGVFTACHGPVIARDWSKLPTGLRNRFATAFATVGERLAACRPDILIVATPDHWVNFFIDNLPAFCIGVGEEHDGPPEPFMHDIFPHKVLKGHPAFARRLLDTAIANDFEPSFSHRVKLDHGVCVPLWRIGFNPNISVVPIFVNELEEPMPTIRRCFAWGRLLRQAIADFASPARIAILGTGGLSHSIGEPTMGWVDEKFDRQCIEQFESSDETAITRFLEDNLPLTGNGAHEVRNWVIAHAAAQSRGFELIDYFPSPETFVGAGFASWRV